MGWYDSIAMWMTGLDSSLAVVIGLLMKIPF